MQNFPKIVGPLEYTLNGEKIQIIVTETGEIVGKLLDVDENGYTFQFKRWKWDQWERDALLTFTSLEKALQKAIDLSPGMGID